MSAIPNKHNQLFDNFATLNPMIMNYAPEDRKQILKSDYQERL